MKFKKLGKSDAMVPAIGLGCMGIGGELSSDYTRDAAQIEALRLGIDLGMTLIDTAEAYGGGHSEELVGEAIRGSRRNVFIATKFSPENNGYNDVLRAAERSLRRLRTDVIDLYQVHWPNPAIPVEETMRGLEKLQQDGKIRHIGVSNFSVREMKAASSALATSTLAANQVEYNLFDRHTERYVLPYCHEREIAVIAYSPLDKGRIPKGERVLAQIAMRYDKTPAQIVLNWLIAQPGVIVIPKAASAAHLGDNAAAADFALADEDVRRIGEAYWAEPVLIAVDDINVSLHGGGNRRVYRTVEQALRNELNFSPSPRELAEDILRGDPIKPVRVVPARTGDCRYDLIEGRIRYWGWVIAYNAERAIPALVRQPE